MIGFNVDKILEGEIEQDVHIKIMHSGWKDSHYIIEENCVLSKFDIKLISSRDLEIKLYNMINNNSIKKEDVVAYFAPNHELGKN